MLYVYPSRLQRKAERACLNEAWSKIVVISVSRRVPEAREEGHQCPSYHQEIFWDIYKLDKDIIILECYFL